MLILLLACENEKPLNDYHDDAGFLLAQVGHQQCTAEHPCLIWDTGKFTSGPRAVAIGRNQPSSAAVKSRHLAKYGIEGDFDGFVGMMAEDNWLYAKLVMLNCMSRGACTIYNDETGTRVATNDGTAEAFVIPTQ